MKATPGMTREQYLATVYPSRVTEPFMVPAGMESEHANDTSEVPVEGPAPPAPDYIMEGPVDREEDTVFSLEDLPLLPPLDETDSEQDEDLFSTPPEEMIQALQAMVASGDQETITAQDEMTEADWLWESAFKDDQMFDMPSPSPSEEDIKS